MYRHKFLSRNEKQRNKIKKIMKTIKKKKKSQNSFVNIKKFEVLQWKAASMNESCLET